jgi:predicted porin
MKKSVLAAALAAITTTVSAQNVTVYGILDTGLQSHDTGATKVTRNANNLWATSRLGFRGVEDLGNGLKANFVLEGAINPSEGSMGSTTVAANEIFNREARLGLSGAFGEVRVGRQDVSFAQDIDTAVSQFANFGNRPTNGTAIELGTDQKNVIKYLTPDFNGFSAQIGRSVNSTSATTDANTDQTSANVRFEKGAFTVHAGWQKTDGATSVAQRDFTAYGVSANLGFASVGYTYGEGDVSTTGDVKNTTHVASVRFPFSAGLSAHAVYAMADDAAQATDNKGKGYALGLSKTLSKRTTLYAAYTAVENESNSTMFMAGQSAPTAGLDPKTVSLGISHTF